VGVFGTSNNLTPKILSIVFAILLWFHITTNQTFSTKYTIPIQYVGPSAGFMIASDCPKESTIIISGQGKDLAAFYLMRTFNSEPFYALANLTGLPEGENVIELDKNMMHLGIFTELQVNNILLPDNGNIKLNIDRVAKRTVAVSTDKLPEYDLPGGYAVVGKPVSLPEFVVVEGPASVIESIDSIGIENFDSDSITKKNQVLIGNVALPTYITSDPEQVEISFRIEQLVTKHIAGVAVSLDGFPVRNRPTVLPDSVDIIVKGAESLLDALSADIVTASIGYRAYLDTVERGDSLMAPSFVLPGKSGELEVIGVSPASVHVSP